MTASCRLEQRRDFPLGLDVRRDAAGGLDGGLPGGRRLGGGRLVRLVEERVAGCARRAVIALRTWSPFTLARRIEHIARIAHLADLAPGAAAVVDAAARPVLVEFDRFELDLALEELLDVADQARVAARDESHRQPRLAGPSGAADPMDVILGVE